MRLQFTVTLLLFTAICSFVHADRLEGLSPLSDLTVRVDPAAGAPRLLVNGVPRRARFFYGQPAPGTIPASAVAREVSFEFTPDQTVQSGATMHFRFGQKAGAIDLANMSVTDVSDPGHKVLESTFAGGQPEFDRDWHIWPPDAKNTVGTVGVQTGSNSGATPRLHIEMHNPSDGVWPDFHIYHEANLTLIKGRRYRAKFTVKSDPPRDLTVAFYHPGNPYVFLGGPAGHYESQVRLAASAGVDFVSFSITMPWPAPGEQEDWQGVDSVCDTTLAANPRALMLPRVPVYAPAWWIAAHRDELMRWEDGSDHGGIASPASELFRVEASIRLDRLVRHLELKYGDHIAGYHPNGQNTGEWFYFDSWNHPLNGYAPCDQVAFRNWARKRYGTEAALRQAWHRPDASFDTLVTPPAAARHAAPAGIFRDAAAERDIIDFSAFQQESMADLVCSLAHVVRRATEGRKLVAFFYGYVFEFGAMPTGPACSGHYALRRVLDCPDIDVLCSPISYFDRGPGESAPSMTAAESVALAGKMWLNEDDTRTYLTHEDTFPGAEHVVKTLAETNGELIRNVAQESLRNFATWWMDLPASGWFDDPGMWAEMARLNRLDSLMLQHPRPFRPQVAAVIDPTAMTLVAEGGQAVTGPCVYEARAALGRMGTPYGQYMLDDVMAGKVHARLYIFTDVWSLSARDRKFLLQFIRGSARIWCYAPGYLENLSPSLPAMRDLTGFDLRPVGAKQAMATPTAKGRSLGLTKPFGISDTIRPLFAPVDARPDEALATYSDGSAAVAMRRTGQGISIFVGVPGLNSELMRLAARAAGVHLYTQSDCCVYANGPFIAVHATSDGRVQINTGTEDMVADLLSGTVLGAGPVVRVTMKRGQTRVLRVGKQ